VILTKMSYDVPIGFFGAVSATATVAGTGQKSPLFKLPKILYLWDLGGMVKVCLVHQALSAITSVAADCFHSVFCNHWHMYYTQSSSTMCGLRRDQQAAFAITYACDFAWAFNAMVMRMGCCPCSCHSMVHSALLVSDALSC